MGDSDGRGELDPVDPLTFRRVLGHYPSGIAAITSTDEGGQPVGLVVSSFTSVSLDPPMVGFFPAKTSSTWPTIRTNGSFCVNVMGADQEAACRQLAAKGGDKFREVDWFVDSHGLPALAGAVARIDCSIEAVHDAGDHEIVLGRVMSLHVTDDTFPLLFFRGGYGRFASSSIAAITEADLVEHLQLTERMRPQLAQVSAEIGVEIFVTGIAGDELVIIATSGHPDPTRLPTQVGLRMPYVPPLGGTVAAFDDPEAWLAKSAYSDETKGRFRESLRRTREQGWSATVSTAGSPELDRAMVDAPGAEPTPEQTEAIRQAVEKLGSEHAWTDLQDGRDYPVRSVTVPVLQRDGRARLALTAFGLPECSSRQDVDLYVEALRALATQVKPPRSVLGR